MKKEKYAIDLRQYAAPGTPRRAMGTLASCRHSCARLGLAFVPVALVMMLALAAVAPAEVIVEYTFADADASTATNTGTLAAAMDGTVTGGAIVASPFSPDGQGLALGGNAGDGIAMPNGYDFSSGFTVEGLVRLDVAQSPSSIFFDDFGGPGVVLLVLDSGVLGVSVTTADNGTQNVNGSVRAVEGRWHHIAVVYDGTEIRLYLDGRVVASQAATGAVDNAAVTPHFGVESEGTVLPWLGVLDDLRVHTVALAPSELNGGFPVPAAIGCPLAPATGCVDTWAKGALLVKENKPGKEKLVAKLKKGPAIAQSELGDPLSAGGTAWTVCVYDDLDNLAGSLVVERAGEDCQGKPCWKTVGKAPPDGKGFKFKDKAGDSDGVAVMLLKGGDDGKSLLQLKATNNVDKGIENLPLGIAALLEGSEGAVVQWFGGVSEDCFSRDMTVVKKNEPDLFKAQ